ncbi:MAG TPA: hypothetical protein VL523_12935 [Terriglobia bacterium]|nr:hypothetical protein [Terriglobia bacterium]
MSGHHVAVGILLLAGTLGLVAARYARGARRPLPLRGWLGGAVVVCAAMLLGLGRPWWVATYLTPIAWTAYILIVDAIVSSLGRPSRISRAPGQFAALALGSIPLWVLFEIYNLRLVNWAYVGTTLSPALEALGYAWAFATIWPAIFETADLFEALGFFRRTSPARRPSSPGQRRALVIAGLLMVTVPVLLPPRIGSYLFGAVWLGFIPLLDPITYEWRGPSLLRDWEAGDSRRLGCFLASGWLCGLVWECVNNWAAARWVYVFPLGQRWKIFEMPAPGFLGFPAFALECFVMWQFLATLRLRVFGRQPALAEPDPGAREWSGLPS